MIFKIRQAICIHMMIKKESHFRKYANFLFTKHPLLHAISYRGYSRNNNKHYHRRRRWNRKRGRRTKQCIEFRQIWMFRIESLTMCDDENSHKFNKLLAFAGILPTVDARCSVSSTVCSFCPASKRAVSIQRQNVTQQTKTWSDWFRNDTNTSFAGNT